MKGSRLFKAISVMLSFMLVFSLFPTQALATVGEGGSGEPTSPTIYTVIFKDSEGNVLKEEKVEAGLSATAPDIPELEGYVADGWDKDFSVVTGDMVVTAQYKEAEDFGFRSFSVVGSYTVTYVDASNPPPSDGSLYALNDDVTVLSPTGRTASGNKVFYYWKSSNGGNIMPGSTFKITSNTTLTAKYDNGYALTMAVKPNGAGTITKTPDYDLYAPGTVVTVLGTPSSSAWALIGYYKNFGSSGAYDMYESNQIVIQPSNTNRVFAVFGETYPYTVKYYKDSISSGNLVGTETGTGLEGDPIPYTNGNFLPPGYVAPGAVSGRTTISDHHTNTLNVVYSKGSFGFTVKYFADSTAGTLLGTETGTGVYGTSIPYSLTRFAPVGYVTPGTVSGQTTITEVASNNVLNVVYSRANYGYTVKYYKDSISTGNLLGTDSGTAPFGSTIPYTDGKYLPSGYVTPGATSGQTTITTNASNNVLKVVYSKGSFGYTVKYFADDTSGTPLGTDTGTGVFGTAIPFTNGKYLPTGYVAPGAVSGQTTITAVASNNVLNVVYSKGSFGYTVKYFADNTSGTPLGTDTGTGVFGTAIPFTNGKYLPTGYAAPGAVSGQTTITAVASNNVLNVVYSKGSFAYTVNYYSDSTSGTLLGTDTGTGTFGDAIPYTNGSYLPTGYVIPGAVSGQTTITAVAADNVLNVVYSKGSFDYTVKYFADDTSGTPLGTDTGTGTFGDAIPFTDGSYLPTGYVIPGAVSGQMTITAVAADNVLNVVYSKGSFGYTVNYYSDSTSGTLLGTETGTGTFGDAIPYTNGSYLPTGYVTPGAVSGQTTITAVAADNVLNVVYSPDSFAVSFLAGTTDPVAGIPGGNPAVVYKTTFTISSAIPTRAGYSFLGWSTSDVNGVPETYAAGSTFAMPATDVTLTAMWSDAIVYRITYVLNGGANDPANPATYTVETLPLSFAAPARLGYNFLGWYIGSTRYTGIAAGTTGDKTFTAKWSAPIRYNITYTMNGGNNSLLNPSSYTIASGTITLRDPWRLGYNFAGWTPTNSIPSGSTGDKAFTATWTPKVYNITYFMQGGTNNPANPATFTVETLPISFATPTKTGYEFWFWLPSGVPSGTVMDWATLAVWKPATNYSITYNLNGGTNNPSNPSTYNVESSTINLADPMRDGYTFNDWSPEGIIPAGSTGNKEFTASWTPITYSISYEMNGGENNPGNLTSYTIETETFTLGDPTRDYYTFAGWTPEDTTIEKGSMGNLTFTASWKPIAYNIEYNLAGGVNDAANPATYTVETPTFTLANPTRLGYTFNGWDPADATIELGSHGDLSFTATWTPIVYPITYVMNGGANPAENPATYTIESPTITLAAPGQAGYVFLGWTPAGVIPTGTTGPLTFTANWSAPIVYDITYVMNGGINAAGNPGTYTVESPLITLDDPTRTGYDFLGWTPTDNIPAGSVGDVTFTATWSQPHVHTVTYFVNGGTEAGLDGVTPYRVYASVAYGSVVPVPANPQQADFTFDGWTTAIPVNMPDEDVVIYGSMTRLPALQEIITNERTPLAGPTWSLLNLILTALTVISIGTIISIFQKRRENKGTKKNTAFSLSTLLPAAGVIVAFIMTQVLTGTMVFTDRWSYLFAGITLVQAVVVTLALTGKTKKV